MLALQKEAGCAMVKLRRDTLVRTYHGGERERGARRAEELEAREARAEARKT
jgi:hypothetical protein